MRLGFSPWVGKIPWRGNGNPLQGLPGKPMSKRNLAVPKFMRSQKSWALLASKQQLDSMVLGPAAAAKSLQLYPTLCDPVDGSPRGSPVPGILQSRTLEWVAISFSNAWKWKVKVKSLSCPTLCDPMDCSLPGSSTHGIFQARILEWVAFFGC